MDAVDEQMGYSMKFNLKFESFLKKIVDKHRVYMKFRKIFSHF